MRVLLLLVVGSAACGFTVQREALPTDARGDAPGDGGLGGEGGDARFCYGAGFGAVCLSAAPTSPLELPNNLGFDTGSAGCTEVVSAQGIELCVLAGTTVSLPLGRTFRGLGARPLVIVAVDTLTIDGLLGVSSLIGSQPGAGSGTAPCTGATPGIDDAAGASGGAGGSFGGRGGAGGTGDLDSSPSAGGMPGLPVVPTTIRAGCPGTSGGTGDSPGGAGRAGGGAIYLIAGAQIAIRGTGGVYSAGRGGGGAMSRGGGGGGGSGGLIGLDAPTVNVVGTIAANGGGGGEGARVQVETGLDGSDGLVGGRAPGGNDFDPLDGAGGDGSEGGGLDGSAGAGADGGGGGGGGGAGYVYLKGARTGGGPISPAASIVP